MTPAGGASGGRGDRAVGEVSVGDKATVWRAPPSDPKTLEEFVSRYRPELQLHCYHILGSFQDAEDVVQETLFAAWRAFDRFDGLSVRGWLYRIATNRCLNHLRATSRRPKTVNSLESTSWIAPITRSSPALWLEFDLDAVIDDFALSPEERYDARESIALLFVAGLQRLPPRQRTVFVLRDVLGFRVDEVADMLGITVASVNSALQRARCNVRQSAEGQPVLPARSRREGAVADHFASAYESGDISQIIALLIGEGPGTAAAN